MVDAAPTIDLQGVQALQADAAAVSGLEELNKAVKAKLAEISPSEPALLFDWRHEEVARAYCRVQWRDPDAKVIDIRNTTRGAFGSVLAGNVVPQWHLYLEMVYPVVQALEKDLNHE